MAGKAVIADVTNEGFVAPMFGNLANFVTPNTGYIASFLARASNWAQQKLTAVNYAAAVSPGYAFDCLVLAETHYTANALWTARVAFINGNATLGLEADKLAALLQKCRDLAAAAMADANYWLSEAMRVYNMDVQAETYGTGASTGVVETGMYPLTDTAALNYGGAQ